MPEEFHGTQRGVMRKMLDTYQPETRRREATGPTLSVIIPTKNEAGNIEKLLRRLESAIGGIPAEVIFVDDSTDDTPAVIAEAARRSDLAVSVIHRPLERRTGGLGGAVVEGMRAATGEWVCVMDADLQHPPTVIPKLLECARRNGTEMAVASRFAPEGDAGSLSPARLLISKATRLAARVFFRSRLRQVSDPLSGFFLVRRESVDPDRLRPRGFKILLEIMIRFPHLSAAEVPFHFETRNAGESKATMHEGLRYLPLLLELRFGGLIQRLTRFGVVGASGLVVNQALLAAFTELMGVHYALSAVAATQGSTTWNFAFSEAWVFSDRVGGRSSLRRFAQYFLVNNGMLLLRGPMLIALTSGLGVHYLVSNVISLLAAAAGRYLLSDGWIWSEAGQSRQRVFNYDIHGIVRITSEARLPELEYFSTPWPAKRPDLRVKIGRSNLPNRSGGEVADGSRFYYQEALGPLGFWADITRGEVTEVVAGPLLKYSPHVLYTNIVEPILRWMLVKKGYALVHGACIAQDGRALLITARTDTGKTSTILRLLSRHPLTFLSDDMNIVCRDGRVLAYPKPLTISYHTLQAVNADRLPFWGRLALQLQSRVHSKSGRLWALILTRFPLPMATINSVVQFLVPPPKWAIGRLIPGVHQGRKAVLVRRVEIERGPDYETELEPKLAEETLLRNCEDAYGFPPYRALEPFLTVDDGLDLRAVERAIMSEAMYGCPTTLISSETRNWWPRIFAISQSLHSLPFETAEAPAIPADNAPSPHANGSSEHGAWHVLDLDGLPSEAN